MIGHRDTTNGSIKLPSTLNWSNSIQNDSPRALRNPRTHSGSHIRAVKECINKPYLTELAARLQSGRQLRCWNYKSKTNINLKAENEESLGCSWIVVRIAICQQLGNIVNNRMTLPHFQPCCRGSSSRLIPNTMASDKIYSTMRCTYIHMVPNDTYATQYGPELALLVSLMSQLIMCPPKQASYTVDKLRDHRRCSLVMVQKFHFWNIFQKMEVAETTERTPALSASAEL